LLWPQINRDKELPHSTIFVITVYGHVTYTIPTCLKQQTSQNTVNVVCHCNTVVFHRKPGSRCGLPIAIFGQHSHATRSTTAGSGQLKSNLIVYYDITGNQPTTLWFWLKTPWWLSFTASLMVGLITRKNVKREANSARHIFNFVAACSELKHFGRNIRAINQHNNDKSM